MAELMAVHDEFDILRRFRQLNMQNLLYLQAEITHLEDELSEITKRDLRHPGRPYHAKDWWSLANGEEDVDREQWSKIVEIREKLDMYSTSPNEEGRNGRIRTEPIAV